MIQERQSSAENGKVPDVGPLCRHNTEQCGGAQRSHYSERLIDKKTAELTQNPLYSEKDSKQEMLQYTVRHTR